MGRDIHHQTLHFPCVVGIHLHRIRSLHIEMTRLGENGNRDERERKTEIIEKSRGNNTENNSIDAKKRDAKENVVIEGGGKSYAKSKANVEENGRVSCRDPYEEFFAQFEKEGRNEEMMRQRLTMMTIKMTMRTKRRKNMKMMETITGSSSIPTIMMNSLGVNTF